MFKNAFFALFLLVGWSTTAAAQFYGATGSAIALPAGEAVYHAESDTYYRLMRFEGQTPYSWEHALKMAKSYQHEGREGFLAIVADVDLHYFLTGSLKVLRDFPVWIGLRVLCSPSVVSKWYTGRPLTAQKFRAWAPDAVRRIRDMCKDNKSYLPVYTTPTELGVRWQVDRKNTNINLLLVAYPGPEGAKAIKAEAAEFEARAKAELETQ